MHMRSFRAKDMQEAMQMARDELGDDAVILSTDKDADGVIVTFALDRDDSPIFDPEPENNPQPVAGYFTQTISKPAPNTPPTSLQGRGYMDILLYHATPANTINRILEQSQTLNLKTAETLSDITNGLTKMLEKAYRFDPLPLKDDFCLMMVGPPGSGKTIASAKIAAKMVVDNKPVTVITTDSKRAAGIDQLQAFTQILGLDLLVAASREELKAMLRDQDRDARIVIDSAGCNPYDFQELKELGEFATLTGIEPVLVCSAGTESGEAEEIAGVYSFLDIERVLISRTDCARRFGSALAVADTANYAFCHMTSSARAMGDLQPLDAAQLALLLTQYQRERIAA